MKTDLMTVLNSTTVQKANGTSSVGNSQSASSYSFGSVDFSSFLSAFDATSKDRSSETGSDSSSSSSSSASADASSDPAAGLSSSDFISLLQSGAINNFGAQVSSMNSSFASDLTSALEDAGVDTSGPITLVTGSDGKVHVAGDNPNASAIESVLAGNEDLTQEYYDVSSANSLAKSLHGAGQYAKHQARAGGGDGMSADMASLWNGSAGMANNGLSGVMTLSDGNLSPAALGGLQRVA
jgi:hypothetical protein